MADPTEHWGTERNKDEVAVFVCGLFLALIVGVLISLWFL